MCRRRRYSGITGTLTWRPHGVCQVRSEVVVPELPEVETVRAGVEQHVVGRTVATAAVMNPRAVRRDLSGPDGFAAAMAGRTFLRAERRGKYLWCALDDGSIPRPMAETAVVPGAEPGGTSRGDDPPQEALLAHLGMSGQLL